MRTTITIDDDLFATASEACGEEKASKVVKVALEVFVARESALRLRAMGGKAPEFTIPARSERMQVAEANRVYPSRKT